MGNAAFLLQHGVWCAAQSHFHTPPASVFVYSLAHCPRFSLQTSKSGENIFHSCKKSQLSPSYFIGSWDKDDSNELHLRQPNFLHFLISLLVSGSFPSYLSHVTLTDEETSIAVCLREHYVYEILGYL